MHWSFCNLTGIETLLIEVESFYLRKTSILILTWSLCLKDCTLVLEIQNVHQKTNYVILEELNEFKRNRSCSCKGAGWWTVGL